MAKRNRVPGNRGAQELQAWMTRHGRTQEWVAEKLGASQEAVSTWLGSRIPSSRMLFLIADLTNIDVRRWIEAPGSEPKRRARARTSRKSA